VVPDNWGGLFEQPAHDPEESNLDLSAIDVFGSAQIRNEHGFTSNVLIALLDVVHKPAPMLDTTSTDSDGAFDSDFSSSDGEAASTDKHNPGPTAIQAMLDATESPHCLATTLDNLDRLSLLLDVLLHDII